MTVVIDCNVFVVCEEIIQRKYSVPVANALISLLNELPNVHNVVPYYKWLLIDADPDDHKYCDCAIAGKADYIVTEDKHFNSLLNISFPKLTVLSMDEFLQHL